MHRHLERQLAQASSGGAVDLDVLLGAVSDYYAALDRERSLRDRSLGLMSEELLALNQQIQEQGEARFRSVFEQAGDALLVADADDRIGRSNSAAAARNSSVPFSSSVPMLSNRTRGTLTPSTVRA